uniref:MICOS complex subunit MIC13 n=1 Tax=Panagrellus redivivus TaxID=6233 RepID=A0A7E4UNX3_PANRE
MGVLWGLTKAGVKVGLVVAAVKLSVDNDVWSLRTEKGSDVYEKLKKYILPGTIVYKEKLPSTEEVQLDFGTRWNNGINAIFNILNATPARLNSGVNSLYRVASDQLQNASTTEKKA